MKKIVLMFFIVVSSTATYAQFFPVDTARLNTAYRELMRNPYIFEVQKEFFDAFPNTWMEFNMTYQYFRSDDFDLTMYFMGHRQIRAFGNLTMIDDQTFSRKLVNLAVGAILDADNPNWLQSILHSNMRTRMNSMLEAVERLRRGHQMQFWQFYWSNIVMQERLIEAFKTLYEQIKDTHPEQARIMSIAFEFFHDGVCYMGISNPPCVHERYW